MINARRHSVRTTLGLFLSVVSALLTLTGPATATTTDDTHRSAQHPATQLQPPAPCGDHFTWIARRYGDFLNVRFVGVDLAQWLGAGNGLVFVSWRDGNGQDITQTFNASGPAGANFTVDIYSPVVNGGQYVTWSLTDVDNTITYCTGDNVIYE